MRRQLILSVAGLSLAFLALPLPARERASSTRPEMQAPAGERPTHIDSSGETILPNGRLITPRGVQVKVAPHPYGLALSPDGKTLVTANSGTAPFSVSIITDLAGGQPSVAQIPPGFKSADADPKSVYIGVAIAPDNRTLYVSEGENGQVGIWDLGDRERRGSLDINGAFQGKAYPNSTTAELRLSRDGHNLYVLDFAHFRLVVLDTQSRQIVSSTPVGRLPLGLALSPDGERAYVSNVGMFRYSLVPDYDPKQARDTGLDFPPFAYLSQEANEGTVVQEKNLAGLGDPNVPESNSVWAIDVSNPAAPSVTARIRTGIPVGDQSVGGSSPGGVVAGRNKVYVANTNQDSITIIDARRNRIEKTVLLEPSPTVRGLRGVLPFGLALSPDEKRLYVACAGINALAVLDARRGKVLGYIPTGWFPAKVLVSGDGKTLYVANAKGFGAGPNGGPDFHEGPEGSYIGDITHGTVSVISVPDQRSLKAESAQAVANNGFVPSADASRRNPEFPVPPPGHPSSKIHHVVFIVKENRTFDQVFGDSGRIRGTAVEADASLAEYGMDAAVKPSEKTDEPTVEHARVTPNHHALARRFAISDNFYVDSDVSVDGHHWLVDNYPNEVLESAWPTAYGGQLDFKPDNDAPGLLEIGSSNPWPETYLEAGSLWEHLARHHISFRNYGEGFEMAGDDEGAGLMPTGVRESVNIPMPEALYQNTSRSYPTFNLNISDQYRFHQFQHDFDLRFSNGNGTLPQLVLMWLPNDHTADPRPPDGFPYRASYVADNDLALGKLVELFSHSPYWKDMAIFVTEDDAQAGRDHVDAHRSVLMVISPYARRGLCHAHTSTSSILKTIDLIFALPYLNQYDAAATDLSDCFTDQPDLTPYDALPSDTRIFDPAKVVEPGLDMRITRRLPSPPLDDPPAIRKELREDSER